MQKAYYLTAIMLLLFNAAGALYGGWLLITHPDGSEIGLSLSLIHDTPFKDYFIPGLILFCANGLLSTAILFITIFKLPHYQKLIFLQGCVLTIWIIVQMLMINMVFYLHFIMGGTGILLMIIAFLMYRFNNKILNEK